MLVVGVVFLAKHMVAGKTFRSVLIAKLADAIEKSYCLSPATTKIAVVYSGFVRALTLAINLFVIERPKLRLAIRAFGFGLYRIGLAVSFIPLRLKSLQGIN